MMNILSKLYAVFCVGLAIWLGVQFTQHTPIQTQLSALLPQETTQNPIWTAADKAQEAQLNQQILLLVGANDSEHAFTAANQVAQTWQQSGLFTRVDGKFEPDLAQLRTAIQKLGVATLPNTQIQQLYHQPQQYFSERAEAAANPFSGSLLPLEDDWLGFSRFALAKQGNSRLMWQPEHAMLYTEHNGKTWVWLRAHLAHTAPNPQLLTLWQHTQQTAHTQHYEVLATGGALFATSAKQAAEHESTWMSIVGLGLTFTLLLTVFRSGRILLLLIPLLVGVLTGMGAAIAIFGEIHALTLVVGTSLVGVLVDFPLHWLAPSLLKQPEKSWNGLAFMRRILPSFIISLTITAVGYILLWFTPLPVLQQTAIFSAGALLGAFAATVLFLPHLFKHYQPRSTLFARMMTRLPEKIQHIPKRMIGLVVVFFALGIAQSHWQDDIRQWMTMRPDLLNHTQQIAQISGMGAGQVAVVTASSPDELLQHSRNLEQQLHNQAKVQALHQWILPTDEQRALHQQLHHLAQQPESFAPLTDLGIPSNIIQAALTAPQNIITLPESLSAPHAEAFRQLYLGEINGTYAGLVRLYDVAPDFRLPTSQHWQLLDKRTHLNQQFTQTRNQAAWLKLMSFVGAWLVLWRLFGWQKSSLILAVPMCAIASTIGVLGWFNIPIGLFAMFGLLLVAAIGVDYAVYALTAPESMAARTAGMTLAVLTTGISFALLAASSTPAVAVFGISVTLGVLFNWFAAMILLTTFSGSLKTS